MSRDFTIRISAIDNASGPLKNVATQMGELKTVAGGADGRSGLAGVMGQLGRELQTAVLGFGAIKLTNTILEMRDIGQQTQAAYNAFVALNGGTREAERTLAGMRTATRGIVDDFTLMRGANRLLMMDLARNSEEAARLTEIAVTLGRTMGKDASQAIEDFSMLLANRSIPRLDNFGISAARVRERVEELRKAGRGLEDAFTMAVLEEGERSLQRLGAAAAGSVSAWDMLGVRVENVKNQLAGVVFQAGETLAKMILIAQYAQGQAAFQREQEAITRESVAAMMTQQGITDALQQSLAYGAITGGVLESANPLEELRQRGMTEQAIRALEAGMGLNLSAAREGVTAYDLSWRGGVTLEQRQTVQNWRSAQSAIAAAEAAGARAETLRRQAQMQAELQANYGPGAMAQMTPEYLAARTAAEAIPARQQQAYLRQSLSGLYSGVYRGAPGLYAGTAESFERLEQQRQWDIQRQQQARQEQEARTEALRGALQAVGGVVDRGLGLIQGAARMALTIHDAMEQAARAALRIPSTLNEWLARGKPTGIEAELYQAIAGQMTPEAREEFLRGTGMVNWRDEFIRMIAGMEPEQAVTIARTAGQYFAAGGQDAGSVVEMMGRLGYYRALGGGGTQYTVQAGDTVSGLAAKLGIPQELIMSQLGITNPRQLRAGAAITTGAGGWQRLPLYMTGGYGGVKMAAEEEGGPAAAIENAIGRIQEMRELLDEVMTEPRTLPLQLELAADLNALGPLLKPIVEQIMHGMQRQTPVGTTGGASTMRLVGGTRVR